MVIVLPVKSLSCAPADAVVKPQTAITAARSLNLGAIPSSCTQRHGGRSCKARKHHFQRQNRPLRAIASARIWRLNGFCAACRLNQETGMFGKLNHLAITTDHYAVLGMFYRAVFGMKVSGDTAREMSAISVGDGYVGMTIIPRRGGRKAGLDHFGIEVEDLDKVRAKVAKKYPDIEIVKRPGNRPFASYSAHDPAGNYFDLSQQGHENRAEVYAKGEWKQDNTISHFALRARDSERMADFYADVFKLEARNIHGEPKSYHLSDGRVTLTILPWTISAFDGAGIEQPAMDHIGFRVPSIAAFKKNLDMVEKQNLQIRAKPIDFDSEGVARLKLLAKCPHGSFHLADPDGTLIDVAEDH